MVTILRNSNDFARVISSESVNRLSELMKNGQIVTGGTTDPGTRYIAPTIIKDVKPDDPDNAGRKFLVRYFRLLTLKNSMRYIA